MRNVMRGGVMRGGVMLGGVMRSQRGGGGFSPASLFANGEAGGVYLIQDFVAPSPSTLFANGEAGGVYIVEVPNG